MAEQEKNNAAIGDDGMETVRLDIEAGDSPPLKPNYILNFLNFTRRNQFPVGKIKLLLCICCCPLLSLLYFEMFASKKRGFFGSRVIDLLNFSRTSSGGLLFM